jgi:hypothetical protein
MAGGRQAKKCGCALDMGSFWLGDKFRIRAEISNFIMSAILLRFLISSTAIIQNHSF